MMDQDTYQAILARFDAQDTSLARIESKLDSVNGTVQRHEKDISFVKRLSYAGTVIASGIWAVYTYLGGK